MLKPKNIYSAAVFKSLLCLFLLIGQSLQAQSISDISWSNGRTSYPYACEMKYLGDSSIITFSGQVRVNGEFYRRVQIVNTTDLSVQADFGLDTTATVTAGLNDLNSIANGYIASVSKLNGQFRYALYKLSHDRREVNLLFKRNISSLNIYGSKVIGNEVFIMSANGDNNLYDTVQLQVLDLQGNYLRQKYYGKDFNGVNAPRLLSIHSIGPMEHPVDQEVLVFGNRYMCQTIEIRKDSLTVKNDMPVEAVFDYRFADKYISDYELFPNEVVSGGTVLHLPEGLQDPSVMVFQSYVNSRKWNGDSILEAEFGDNSVAERCYAFCVEPASRTYFLAGAAPFYNFMTAGAEYRSCVIHRFTSFGEDSIVLYGQKNHVPIGLDTDNDGNLFMLSTFTEVWTTDSTYFTLTKIPAYAISLVENQEVDHRVHLYPNPSSDYVMLDHFPEAVQQLSIYDEQGGKLHHAKVENDEKVDISFLAAGVYVFVLEANNGQRFSSIVRKI